jgi:hypothetical protein
MSIFIFRKIFEKSKIFLHFVLDIKVRISYT